jgi:hypothetical protein
MESTDAICILQRCGFKSGGRNELKVKANNQILEQLELSRELHDAKDDGDNIFICLHHLHQVIDGSRKRTGCLNYYLKHKRLPEKFIVGFQTVPKTFKLATYRKLQLQQKSKLSFKSIY